MTGDKFVPTNHMDTISNQVWVVTSTVGAALCFLVLLAILIARVNPVSRPHLDRVSFRLLTLALVANTIFSAANAIGGSFTGPTWACGFTIFILQFTLELSGFLIFAIALNVQLVVVHGINGQKMERYYILGSFILSLCITIPPYAAKQYGWDPVDKACWYSNDNEKERMAWKVGTQLFWTLLTVIGELCASVTVIVCMIKHRVAVRRDILPLVLSVDPRRRLVWPWSALTSSTQHPAVYANAYTSVMVRIGLYPLTSCLFNIISLACFISATQTDTINNRSTYGVLLLSNFLYGGRAIAYAFLAATDPSLLRAAKALIRHIRGRTTDSNTNAKLAWEAVKVEPTTIRDVDCSISVESGGRDVNKELWEAQLERQHQEELAREQGNTFKKQI